MIIASAPGSMMLMGEHAVVRGGLGIAASLKGRVYVKLNPRNDLIIHIKSDRFDAFSCQIADLSTIENHVQHLYSIEVLRYFQSQFTQGVDIEIESDLSPTHGFGSSAALVVALVAALHTYRQDLVECDDSLSLTPAPGDVSLSPAPRDVFAGPMLNTTFDVALFEIAAIAKDIIIKVQGQASGCDAYTSTLGGVVAISSTPRDLFLSPALPDLSLSPASRDLFAGSILPMEKRQVYARRFDVSPPLTAIYTGYKTKTPIVLKQVAEAEAKQPAYFDNLFKQIDVISEKALLCLEQKNWQALGELMRQQFDLQKKLGVVDKTSVAIIETIDRCMKETRQPFGAKISGSGLGDCLIALGDLPANLFPNTKLPNTEQFSIALECKGVSIHVNT